MVPDLIAIMEAGEKGQVARLRQGLKNKSPAIRYWAATWLGVQGNVDASNVLVKATSDPILAVRIAAALALSRIGQSQKGEDVILQTIDDGNWLAGMYAIRALEWSGIRTPAALAAVTKAKDNPYEFTRRIAKRLSSKY